MKKLAVGAAVLAGVTALLVGATAYATPASPSSLFSSVELSKVPFGEIDLKTNDAHPHQVRVKTHGESDVYVLQITVKPGGHSGWHTHPGPTLVSVKSGTATFYDGDDPTCTPHSYTGPAGTVDLGDGHVHILRNEGTVDVVIVAVQFVPAGAARRIDAPDPGNCTF